LTAYLNAFYLNSAIAELTMSNSARFPETISSLSISGDIDKFVTLPSTLEVK